MNITILLPPEQILVLAQKLGYSEQIEDTSQPLEGDSYPLIDNPLTLEQFVEGAVNQTLLTMVQDRIRSEVKIAMENIHNQAIDMLQGGIYDADLMTLPTPVVLQKIIGDLTSG